MSILSFKRLAFALGVLCAILFVVSGGLVLGYGRLHLGVADVDYQTEVFDEMRTQAFQSTSASDIVAALNYAAHHYPSGTKQRAGSRLDRVVERHRRAVVRDMIAHLRRTTGEDLGESPEPWIQKYAKP